MKTERLSNHVQQEWHVAINKHTNGLDIEKWPRFMYEAKKMADEIPRMALLFKRQREGSLPKVHQQCSHCKPEPIPDNFLCCCLGKKCHECPMLLALDAARMTPEEIDQAKAWTCAAHIVANGGDVAGEGYLMDESDRRYWSNLYQSLAGEDPEPEET